MTKAQQARLVAWRLKILNWAQSEPRSVARTCRYFSISRTAFYRWKKRYEEHGEAVLAGQSEKGGRLQPKGNELLKNPSISSKGVRERLGSTRYLLRTSQGFRDDQQ